MNIRAEKLTIIEQLINIDDKELLKKIKDLLSKKSKTIAKPMDIETFLSKVEESEEAYKAGKVTSQDELRKEIKSWRKK